MSNLERMTKQSATFSDAQKGFLLACQMLGVTALRVAKSQDAKDPQQREVIHTVASIVDMLAGSMSDIDFPAHLRAMETGSE